jgi:hypothetical protein
MMVITLHGSGDGRAYREREAAEFTFHDSDSLLFQYALIEQLN